MKMTIRAMVVIAAMLVGVGAAGAQMMDPSTGMMVDPTTDPFDYMNIASGQPGNATMEFAAQVQAQQAAQQAQQDAQSAQDFQNSVNNTMTQNNDDNTPAAPAIPKVAKPVILPKGGTFKGEVTVTIADKDAMAEVHYTTDGKKPTAGSPIYFGPITVQANEKVQALAIADGEQASGVASNKYKVKAVSRGHPCAGEASRRNGPRRHFFGRATRPR
jgi:Chitobiase/beta-hexosaminidase C-terminal domain